jgi:hypothetical protein
MSEIYWITRLDLINGWLIGFAIIAVVITIISALFYIGYRSEFENYERERDERWMKWCEKVFKISLPCLLLFVTSSILTPTTKEALLIFGVGGTIDYVKSNEVVKQLPDKCVDALDAWVESLNIKNKEE